MENGAHSCVIVWEAPHAPEKTIKINIEIIRGDFLPNISDSFAQMMSRPERNLECFESHSSAVGLVTSVCEQVRGNNPATSSKPL